MYWVRHEDGYRCTREGHGNATFAIGEVCTACITDPGEVGITQTSDDVDAEIARAAAECGQRSRRMWRECENLLDDGTAQDKNVAVKLSAEAAKWHRLELEAKDKIAARKHLREAMAHEREMASTRGHH